MVFLDYKSEWDDGRVVQTIIPLAFHWKTRDTLLVSGVTRGSLARRPDAMLPLHPFGGDTVGGGDSPHPLLVYSVTHHLGFRLLLRLFRFSCCHFPSVGWLILLRVCSACAHIDFKNKITQNLFQFKELSGGIFVEYCFVTKSIDQGLVDMESTNVILNTAFYIPDNLANPSIKSWILFCLIHSSRFSHPFITMNQ